MLKAWPLWTVPMIALWLWAEAPAGEGPPSERGLGLARQYLEADDDAARRELARRLDARASQAGSLCHQRVVRALRPKPSGECKAGYFKAGHFQVPELRRKHPDDLLFYVVPESYRPEKATGLIVMMHGGGKGSKRDAPDRYMKMADTGLALGNEFARSGMIAVGPSAPWNEECHQRWCLPEADDYIRDVILDFEARFNIDPDRVVLVGHSMGGFGAYHQVQRQPDRFAAVLSSAGAWGLAYWPVIRGTPLWMVQGARDAEPGKRLRHTDVAYARLAHKLLAEQGIPHDYREHPGTHAVDDARKELRFFFQRMPKVRRDPFYPHVVVASPRGWTTRDKYEAPHNRWLTILETATGRLTYDCLRSKGPPQSLDMPLEDWAKWRLVHSRRELAGAMVEAVNRGDNHFDVTTRNVRRFAIWLHHRMVDFARPVRVTVDGKQAFDRRVSPSLSAALRSFERRRDWGLIYTAEIQIGVKTLSGEP